jgi:hypothetical protein
MSNLLEFVLEVIKNIRDFWDTLEPFKKAKEASAEAPHPSTQVTHFGNHAATKPANHWQQAVSASKSAVHRL